MIRAIRHTPPPRTINPISSETHIHKVLVKHSSRRIVTKSLTAAYKSRVSLYQLTNV